MFSKSLTIATLVALALNIVSATDIIPPPEGIPDCLICSSPDFKSQTGTNFEFFSPLGKPEEKECKCTNDQGISYTCKATNKKMEDRPGLKNWECSRKMPKKCHTSKKS